MSVTTIAIFPLLGMPARCLCHQLSCRRILLVRAMHMLSEMLVSMTSSSSSAKAPTATPAAAVWRLYRTAGLRPRENHLEGVLQIIKCRTQGALSRHR